MLITPCVSVPYLHASTPAAHVFPQQQAVERRGRDEVGELVEGLLHLRQGQSLMGQSLMKGSQLPQHRRHGGSIAAAADSPRVRTCPLSGRHQLYGISGQTWDGLTLQHGRN